MFFDDALAFEHHGENEAGLHVRGVVLLDHLFEQCLGVIFLNGLGRGGWWHLVNTLPMRNVAAYCAGLGLMFLLPATGADIPALEALHATEKNGVVRLFVLECGFAIVAVV